MDLTEDPEDLEQCPECKDSIVNKPRLVFLFANCCGKYFVCEECVSRKFRRGKRGLCMHCQAQLTESNFSRDTLPKQQYKAGTNVRDRLQRIFNLTREDFQTEREHNDYLERLADITFNLTFGAGEEKKAAEDDIVRCSAEYKELRQRRLQQELEKARGPAPAAAAAVPAELASMPQQPLPSFRPSAFQQLATSSVAAVRELQEFVMQRLQEYHEATGVSVEALTEPSRMAAGGYRAEYDTRRSYEESMAVW